MDETVALGRSQAGLAELVRRLLDSARIVGHSAGSAAPSMGSFRRLAKDAARDFTSLAPPDMRTGLSLDADPSR
jgi:hypothetical protein